MGEHLAAVFGELKTAIMMMLRIVFVRALFGTVSRTKTKTMIPDCQIHR